MFFFFMLLDVYNVVAFVFDVDVVDDVDLFDDEVDVVIVVR